MEKISVSKYLVSLMPGTGVDLVHVLQGGSIMKLIDEVGEHPELEYLSPNNEQALAMMVDGYAHIKGFGIGMVTSGPGAQNLATGIASAYYDSTPCMFITGQVGMFHNKGDRRVRQRGFQETDVIGIMKPITKYAVLLDKPEDARYVFEKAVHVAKSGRPGPVVIDIPFNVQRAFIDPSELRGFIPEDSERLSLENLDKDIKNILADIKIKERPIFLLGGGIQLSGQAATIRGIVKKSQIPVATTWCALDVFEVEDPLYVGNIGRAGNKSANRAIREADLVIALGTRFATKAIINEKNFAINAKIVAVDIDRGELEDGLIPSQIKLQYDLRDILPKLFSASEKATTVTRSGWLARIAELKKERVTDNTIPHDPYVSPYEFTEKLSKALKSDAVIVGDTGTNLCWFAQAYQAKFGQRMISSWGNSPMGYALPASIGVQLAAKDRMVITINGDGGMQMNIQELQTIALHNIPVKVFVLNNDCYANVKFPAIDEFGGRFHALGRETGYGAPDFVKIANAYGIRAFAIERKDDMEKKIKEALGVEGPVVIDVKIDPEQRAWEDLELLTPPPIPK
jgi:acetolactate synthase-1/2/3 large subunit